MNIIKSVISSRLQQANLNRNFPKHSQEKSKLNKIQGFSSESLMQFPSSPLDSNREFLNALFSCSLNMLYCWLVVGVFWLFVCFYYHSVFKHQRYWKYQAAFQGREKEAQSKLKSHQAFPKSPQCQKVNTLCSCCSKKSLSFLNIKKKTEEQEQILGQFLYFCPLRIL